MAVLTPDDLPEGKYYKLTNKKEEHDGEKFQTGENVNCVKFNSTGKYLHDELDFFHESQLLFFRMFYPYWIREVTFPEDAKIYLEKDKYKCNKFILSERSLFSKFKINLKEEIQLAAVKQHGSVIQYIQNNVAIGNSNGSNSTGSNSTGCISEEVQLAAVNQDGWLIQFIENPNEKVQLAAVVQSGWSIQFIKNPNEKVQLAAVRHDGTIIEYIQNPSEEVQLAAVKQNEYAIQYINSGCVIKYTV